MNGTTSACAENICQTNASSNPCRNYLRVRGEYATDAAYCAALWELPPRARRIQRCAGGLDLAPGTTSACAENTPVLERLFDTVWNYLRVRGEYKRASRVRH